MSRSAVNQEKYKTIRVFYTGGTIGMQKNDEGELVPVPNAFKQKIKKMSELHSEEEAMNVVSYVDYDFVLSCSYCESKILYKVEEYSPLLDSSNMSQTDWVRLARDIKKNYDQYDGFVILHGTDTLAYTASALSFMLEGLRKSVILTGSMIPIFENRTDATNNIVCSLLLAGCYAIPEVAIFFGNKLFRGNRTSKISAEDLIAFKSLSYPALAVMNFNEKIHHNNIMAVKAFPKNLRIQENISSDVIIVRVYPGIKASTLLEILKPPVKGVVLQCFGAGNVPSSSELLEVLKAAVDQQILIVRVTQCLKGNVSELYEVGAALAKIGVIPGVDMTTEAAFAKLCWVLANNQLSFEEKCVVMKSNIRGELTGENSQL